MAVIGMRDGEATALPLLLPQEKEEVMPWRQWVREVGRLGYLALPMVVGHLPDVLPPSSVIIATSVTTVSIFFLFFTSMIGIEQDERYGNERAKGKGAGGKRQRHGPGDTGGKIFVPRQFVPRSNEES
jgi:hypothetical protein